MTNQNGHDLGDTSLSDQHMLDTSMIESHNSICTALYSGIQVIELTTRGHTVIRRRNDSFFNVSQILALSGLNEDAIFKALEPYKLEYNKEGELKGHWAPFDKAVALAQQYNVYNELKPLFFFDNAAIDSLETPKKIQSAPTLVRNYSDLTDKDEDNENQGSPLKKSRVISDWDIPIFTHDTSIENPNKPYALEPLDPLAYPDFEDKKEQITRMFSEDEADLLSLDDKSYVDDLKSMNMDIPLDSDGHTALHWASILGRVSLVEELIKRGANRLRGNSLGESSLVRAILFTNNYDQGTFFELLNYLYPCITLLDSQDRTILHHITLTAGIKRRSSASRYYLTTLLEWIVKVGGNIPSNPISIGRFMKEIVNVQDKNGDTALNIAARIGNKAIVQELLDIGADSNIANKANLRPIDFGIKLSGLTNLKLDDSYTNGFIKAADREQSSEKILNSMKSMLARLDGDFKQELSIKQERLDKLRYELKVKSSELAQTRSTHEKLKTYESRLLQLRQKLTNLNKSITEQEQIFITQSQSTDLTALSNLNNIQYDPDEPFRITSSAPHDLPPVIILKARIKAYLANQSSLQQIVGGLNQNSKDLEVKFKRVISLCCEGTREEDIDQLIDGLVLSVESDLDEFDMARVRGFLKRVDDGN